MSDPANTVHGLTTRQRAFADAWVAAKREGVELTGAEVAIAAGYSGDDNSLRVTASRTLAHPRVREYLVSKAREMLQEGAVDVALTLRKLTTSAKSERVRADTAARLATGLGLIDGEHGERGPAVVMQIIMPEGTGAALAQYAQRQQQPKVIQGIAEPTHSLAKGEGEVKAPARRSRRTPPPGQAQAAEAPPGIKNRARKSPAGSTAQLPSRKSPGKSGGSDG